MAFRLVLTSPKGDKGLKRLYADAREQALRAAGEYWAKEILPAHFNAGAEKKYGYAPRTERYLRRKRREGRGQDPNVYTGRLAQKMLATAPSYTVNKRGLVLVWRGLPRYTFVVDTMEFVKADGRWDDETFTRLRSRATTEDERAKAEKAISGILRWRREHPQGKDGRFKLVKRPDKVKELTAINRADADAVGKAFRTAFMAGIKS